MGHFDHVRDAYLQIRDGEKLDVKRVGCNMASCAALTVAVAAKAAAKVNGSKGINENTSVGGRSNPEVVVLGDNMSGEAVSNCQVLASLICQIMQVDAQPVGDSEHIKSVMKPTCTIVSLTPGAVTSKSFVEVLIAAHRAWAPFPLVTVQSTDFIFPTRAALEDEIYEHMAQATRSSIKLIKEVYNPIFSILALPFDASGNVEVMMVEARKVVDRVQSQQGQASKGSQPKTGVTTEG